MLGFRRRTAICVIAIIAIPAQAFAWGIDGHHIVAHIAAHNLTPAARSQVEDLFQGDAEGMMVMASTWADEIRSTRPTTAPWHFVNIPIGSTGYIAQRDCERDDCVVAQIERTAKVIGDRQLLRTVRAEALRFLIHFVGDIHQPLHASNNSDRGGNAVAVIVERRRTNLHAIWDTDVIRALGSNPQLVGAALQTAISDANRRGWQSGNAAAWANESFQIAIRDVYSHLGQPTNSQAAPLLFDRSYSGRHGDVVRVQLQKAGVRLAGTLNRAFR